MPDVFQAVLSEEYPETESVNWRTIQLLPQAREALNSWILTLLHHRDRRLRRQTEERRPRTGKN